MDKKHKINKQINVQSFSLFSALSQDAANYNPASYNPGGSAQAPNSAQIGEYDYSYGTSYGGSYGADDLKDSEWYERQNRK